MARKKKGVLDDEFEFDFSKFKSFFKKSSILILNNKFLTVLALLIPLILAFTIRIQPMYLSVVDDWAENSVYSSLESNVLSQISIQYPNLPLEQKRQLALQEIEKLISENKDAYYAQVRSTSDYFKSKMRFDDRVSSTYLGDLDSYYFVRQAKNFVETGTVCDSFNNEVCWDDLILAPRGLKLTPLIHPYLIAYTHKFISVFNKDQYLLNSAFWVQIIIGVLSIIPVFFLTRKIAGNIGGCVAGIIIASSPIFLSRALGSDSDLYHIIAPLLIVWLFYEAFSTTVLKKKIVFASLAGVSVGLASFMWGIWWYFFDIILLSGLAYVAFLFIQNRFKHKKYFTREIKNDLLVLLVFIIFSGIFVSLTTSFSTFVNSPLSPLRSRTILSAAHSTLWPNVYTTVAELNPTNISTAVNGLGGKLLFFLASLGVLMSLTIKNLKSKDYWFLTGSGIYYLFMVSDRILSLKPLYYAILFSLPILFGLLYYSKDKIDTKYAFLIIIWYAVSFYTLTQGVRFIILLIPPFAIALGIFFGRLNTILTENSERLSISKNLFTIFVIILAFLLLLNPVRDGFQTSKNYIPSISDAWVETLEKINLESEPTAIINSWWDFGHWFKYFAERGVTADGGAQNTPVTHWLGLALQTSDENLSVGTLRMLVCSGNEAFEVLNKEINDTEFSYNHLRNILPLSKEKALEYLEENNISEPNKILELTKCENPPEDYLITSEDMTPKSGVWAHFGLWDFQKAWLYNNAKNVPQDEILFEIQERYDVDLATASKWYSQVNSLKSESEANNWISPWPSFMTREWKSCTIQENITVCSLNIALQQQNNQKVVLDKFVLNNTKIENSEFIITTIDTTNNVKLGSIKGKPLHLILANQTLEKIQLENSTLGIDIIFDAINNQVLVTAPELSESTYTKLFYLDGRYSDNFKKFHDVTSFRGERIITWKVNFE